MFNKSDYDDIIYWVWLSLQTPANNLNIRSLLLEKKDPKLIYFMKEKELENIPYLDSDSVSHLIRKDVRYAEKIVEICAKKNYNIICYDDEFYPDRLRNITTFPILLYHRGTKYKFDDLLSISVVGTRNATSYGLSKAREISRDLAYNNTLPIALDLLLL